MRVCIFKQLKKLYKVKPNVLCHVLNLNGTEETKIREPSNVNAQILFDLIIIIVEALWTL